MENNTNVKVDSNVKLSFLERFAYGMGDYAGNLVYSAISAFLLVYYTNVVGASAAAAASIIAKVTRDRIMRQWDEVYPIYGFAKHKGYGTAEHIKAIKENGPCILHRKTFIKSGCADFIKLLMSRHNMIDFVHEK